MSVMRNCLDFDLFFAGADGAAEAGEGFDDGGGPGGEFFVAEGAVVGLEDGAEEEGVDAGVLLFVAPDFDGLEALQLGDGEGVNGGGDGVPLDGVGEDEGEVALDGLEAGEVVGGDFFEGEIVERGEVELGEVDGLAEFAAVGFGGGEFAEVGYGVVVEEGGGGAAGLEPGGGFGGEGEGGGAAGWGEEGEQGFDGAFELEEEGRPARCSVRLWWGCR